MMQRKDFLASFAMAGLGGRLASPSPSASRAHLNLGENVSMQYLGTAGWIVRSAAATVLIDPYVSRINGPPPPGSPQYTSPGDTRRVYRWDDTAESDERAIADHIAAADAMLVTHTHYDHVLDAPHIAIKTNAIVIATESTQNVMRAYDVPEVQLITVRGGEDYDFGSFSVKVVPSLHSALDHKHYFSSATAPAGLKSPLTLRQIHPEGGTLAFLVRFGQTQVLAFGSMNYVEREIDGLRPNVVIAGAGKSRLEIYQYTARLMHALGYPPVVLPTHWDNFLAPYSASQSAALESLQSFVHEVHAASPGSRVVVPSYFQTFSI